MAKADSDVVLGQRYRLLKAIASGGMGSVWEAEDTILHRRVAVKILSEALASDPRFSDRFRREALSAAGLSHPSVASVYDYGENGGPPFIVMELVEGETLAERLRRAPMPHDEAVRIAVAIAAALQAAHDAGIVHRDVKPGNVMLTPTGEVRVLDFGISAAAGAPLTSTGARMGTATYLSPEQARGEPPTAASDVYSLAVVLYEMLAGRPPFRADNPVAVAAAHIQSPPPALTDAAPDVPAHVASTVERALAKDPAARPPSAAAFASMLKDQALPPDPAPAPAPTGPEPTMILPPSEPTAVLVRRRRIPSWTIPVALTAAVLVGLIAFMQLSGGSSLAPPGTGSVTVPNMAGLSLKDAQDTLRAAGLEPGQVIHVEGEKDRVVRTDPPDGSRVAPGSTVTLYVGSPPKDQGHGHDGKGHGGDGN